jgi:hypothetical protein
MATVEVTPQSTAKGREVVSLRWEPWTGSGCDLAGTLVAGAAVVAAEAAWAPRRRASGPALLLCAGARLGAGSDRRWQQDRQCCDQEDPGEVHGM